MAPNLFVAAHTAVNPRLWFHRTKSTNMEPRTEHWESPIPGTYTYTPGRGWFLVQVDAVASTPASSRPASIIAGSTRSSATTPSVTPPTSTASGSTSPTRMPRIRLPQRVVYSRVLHRYLLEPDYMSRKTRCHVRGFEDEVGLFRLDDGVTWIIAEDQEGNFVRGPYERFIFEKETKKFRPMRKGDDPRWVSYRNTPAATEDNTPSASRRGSAPSTRPVSSGTPKGEKTEVDDWAPKSHAEILRKRLGEEKLRTEARKSGEVVKYREVVPSS